MTKIAIIDIDNTLWDFASILYDRLRYQFKNSVPLPSEWHNWKFWEKFCNADTFYKIVREIHFEQDKFSVYPDAKEFLLELRQCGFSIVIASHRDPQTHTATVKWLQKHRLSFDKLHLSYDKTQLFHNCHVCVDDSPEVLKSAANKGLLATGLEFPWNKRINNEKNIKLFFNLSDVLSFIKSEINHWNSFIDYDCPLLKKKCFLNCVWFQNYSKCEIFGEINSNIKGVKNDK